VSAAEPWFRRAFDAPYLEVYAHRDAAEAEHGTTMLLQPWLAGAERVLDLACGAGRWARAVASQGPRVVGTDLSRALLAVAQQQAPPLPLVQSDMLHIPFRAESFDVVLSMFTSFGYFESEDDDRRVLREIQQVLRPAGVLVLDVLNAPAVRQTLVPESARRVGRWQVRERRHIDAARNMVIKSIELDDGESQHTYREEVRLWERAALEDALRNAGFTLGAAWGSYVGAPHTSTSPRLILQARRANAPA
jgi:SAM-dependent methyltransferase